MLFLCGKTVQMIFVRPLRWGLLLSVVTKVTKNTLLSTAQERSAVTALRGKSRTTLLLRLHIRWF